LKRYLLPFILFVIYPSFANAQPAFNIIPSVSISERYDSNIFNDPRDSQTDDFMTRISGQLNGLYNTRNVELKGFYMLESRILTRHPEGNVVIQDGSLKIDLERFIQKYSKNINLNIDEDFTYSPDLPDSYFNERRRAAGKFDRYGIRIQLSDAFVNSFSMTFQQTVSLKTNLRIGYFNELVEYKNPAFTDSLIHGFQVGTDNFRRSSQISNTFEFRILNRDATRSLLYTYLLGYTLKVRTLTVELIGGLSLLDAEENRRIIERGSVALTNETKYLTMTAAYNRSLQNDIGVGTIPYISQLVRFSLLGTYSKNKQFAIDNLYISNRTPRGEIKQVNKISVDSFETTGRLIFNHSQSLTSTFSISYTFQNSNTPDIIDMTRNLVSITINKTWE